MPKKADPKKCPYASGIISSPDQIEDSQETFVDYSVGPCPMSLPKPRKSSADHCQDVVVAAQQIYSKRAKYNKEFDEITKTGMDIIAEQVEIDKAQEEIDKAIEALDKRRVALEKTTETHKKREQESKALLKEIEDGMCKMNEEIFNAYLD
jgi:hypothetical protein